MSLDDLTNSLKITLQSNNNISYNDFIADAISYATRYNLDIEKSTIIASEMYCSFSSPLWNRPITNNYDMKICSDYGFLAKENPECLDSFSKNNYCNYLCEKGIINDCDELKWNACNLNYNPIACQGWESQDMIDEDVLNVTKNRISYFVNRYGIANSESIDILKRLIFDPEYGTIYQDFNERISRTIPKTKYDIQKTIKKAEDYFNTNVLCNKDSSFWLDDKSLQEYEICRPYLQDIVVKNVCDNENFGKTNYCPFLETVKPEESQEMYQRYCIDNPTSKWCIEEGKIWYSPKQLDEAVANYQQRRLDEAILEFEKNNDIKIEDYLNLHPATDSEMRKQLNIPTKYYYDTDETEKYIKTEDMIKNCYYKIHPEKLEGVVLTKIIYVVIFIGILCGYAYLLYRIFRYFKPIKVGS